MIDYDRLNTACLGILGEAATYEPPGGGMIVNLSVIYARQYITQFELQGYQTTVTFPASVVTANNIVRGGTLTVRGKAYTIQEDPHLDDGDMATLALELP